MSERSVCRCPDGCRCHHGPIPYDDAAEPATAGDDVLDALQCYCLAGEDWVIATSPAEALGMWEHATGESWEACAGEPLGDDWEIWGLERTITITDDDGVKSTRTVAEWIRLEGAGLLCSANW